MSQRALDEIENLITDAMKVLGFRVSHAVGSEERATMKRVIEHAIQAANKDMTCEEFTKIVLDLSITGEDYGWHERFRRGFCAALRAKYSTAAVNRPAGKVPDLPSCAMCGGRGEVFLTITPRGVTMYRPNRVAVDGRNTVAPCVCPKGRWIRREQTRLGAKPFDLASDLELLGRLRSELEEMENARPKYTSMREMINEITRKTSARREIHNGDSQGVQGAFDPDIRDVE